MRTYMMHNYKPKVVMSSGYVIQRWTGKAWDDTMCSPYKTMAEVRKHLQKYSWHYTNENPYRIKDYKPKINKNATRPKIKKPNFFEEDYGMVYSF